MRIDGTFNLPNVIDPLDYEDDLIYKTNASDYLPDKDDIFTEHVRARQGTDVSGKIRIFILHSLRAGSIHFDLPPDVGPYPMCSIDKSET